MAKEDWRARARRVAELDRDTAFHEKIAVAGLRPGDDLRYGYWAGIDFGGSRLSGFDFSGSDLSGCSFRNAYIAGAHFDKAILAPSTREGITDLSAAADYAHFVATYEPSPNAPISLDHLPPGAAYFNGPGTWERRRFIAPHACHQYRLVPQVGHASPVTGISITQDGHNIISASRDGQVKVWNNSGELLRTIRGYFARANAIAVTPDGQCIVGGCSDAIVRVWNLATGTEQLSLPGHERSVEAVAVTQDGRLIVSGSADGTIKIWDRYSGSLLNSLTGHTDIVTSIAASPDSRWIVSGSSDRTARVWNILSGKPVQIFKGHFTRVTSVAVSPDSKRALSGDAGGNVYLWDLRRATVLQSLPFPVQGTSAVTFAPDGSHLATVGAHGGLLWNKNKRTFLSGRDLPLTSLAISPDSSWIACGDSFGTIKIWDAVMGRRLRTMRGIRSGVTIVSSDIDRKLIVSGNADKTVRVWNAATGALVHTLRPKHGLATAVGISWDGKRILAGFGYGDVEAWDAISGQPIKVRVKATSDTMVARDGSQVKVRLVRGKLSHAATNAHYHWNYIDDPHRNPWRHLFLYDRPPIDSHVTADGGAIIFSAGDRQTRAVSTLLSEKHWVTVLADGLTYSGSVGCERHMLLVSNDGSQTEKIDINFIKRNRRTSLKIHW